VLRKLRAALVIACVWAVVWMPIGLGLALYASSRAPKPGDVIFRPVSLPLFVSAWSAWGAVSGALFAFILGFAERRRRVGTLSRVRSALWGALGCMTVPAGLTLIDALRTPPGVRGYGWGFPLAALAVSAGLGAICAVLTLALARRPS